MTPDENRQVNSQTDVVIERTYEPDLDRQVAAILCLLRRTLSRPLTENADCAPNGHWNGESAA